MKQIRHISLVPGNQYKKYISDIKHDIFSCTAYWIFLSLPHRISAICLHSLAIYEAFWGADGPHSQLQLQLPPGLSSLLSILEKRPQVHCKSTANNFPSTVFSLFSFRGRVAKILIKSKFEINKMFVISEIYCNRRAQKTAETENPSGG